VSGTNARLWRRLEAAAISASKSPVPGTGALVVDGRHVCTNFIVSFQAERSDQSGSGQVDRAGGKVSRRGFDPPPRSPMGQEALFADHSRLWVLQGTTPDLSEGWTELTMSSVAE
jgi:hypothetical protein